MLGMFCHNKSVFKKDVLLLLLSKLIDSGERAVVLCWTQWVGAAALSSSAHWGRPTLPLCAGHSANNSWAMMVWFVISPLYTYILFQNACEDNILHAYVCMSVMYAFVFTCAWVHMWGVHMEYVVSMEDIEKVKVICLLQSLSISYIEAGSLTHWNWNVSCQSNGPSVGSSLWTLTFGPLAHQQCTLCYDTLALILDRGCWGSQAVPLVLMLGSDHV